MANRKITLSKTKTATSVMKQIGVSAALLLASANASALGLGALEVQSNLDQPLNGTIELRTSAGDDVRSLKAVIASREDFESLGIDYPEYLTNLSLVVEDTTGSKVLRVRSNDVIINEPFIHFLVRVEWSGGSFLREYTALIDPPVYAAEAPRAVAPPRAVGTDQSYQDTSSDIEVEPLEDEAPVDESYETDVQTDEVVTDVEEPTVGEEEPLIDDDFYETGDEPVTEESPETVAADQENDGASYGPVASGESLSLIAQELQRQFPDLSIYSIMQVMFEENQSAFIKGNINGLIQGSVLEIDDLNTIRAVDAQAAKTFFSTQLEEWDPSVLTASSDDSINVGQDEYSYSDVEASDDSDGSDAVESFQVGASDAADDFVSSDQGASRDGEVLALSEEISELKTSLASSELEKRELRERISSLEGQLSDLNRLVELENTGLAEVQDSLAQQDASEAVADDLAVDDSVDDNSAIDEFLSESAEGEVTTEPEASADDILSEFATDGEGEVETPDETLGDEIATDLGDAADDAEAVLDGFLSDTGDAVSDIAEDGSETLSSAIDEVVEDTTSTEITPAETTPPVVQTEKPQSFVDKAKSMIFDGGLWKVLAGVGGLLVAGLVFLFFRRRRADEEFEISMLSIESNSHSIDTTRSESQSASISTSVASVAETVPDKETSFLTVYSDSDAVVQADEVDPVAEADVYIAYGRDEQAEEVLLDGIAGHPERVDIKHKLLSLYHKTENAEGFERVAEELYSQREAVTPEVWEEVSTMGKQIAPENPLFDLSVGDLTAAASSMIIDTDSVTDAATEAVDDVKDTAAELTDAVGEVTDEAKEAAEKIDNSLNDEDSIHLINFEDGRSEISELDDVEIDALDIDADSNADEKETDVIEFNDSALNIANEAAAEGSKVAEVSLDDDADLDLDLDFNTEIGDDEASIGEVSEVSDLEIDPDYDEARTQYELAKVFVDLGDEDGARKILNELVANDDNDESVISDAKRLLDSISG